MIRKLARSIRQYKRDTILTPLSMTLEVIMEVLLPIIMADLIDNGISAGNSAVIWRDGLLLAGVSILSLLSGLLGGVFGARASSGFARNLRHDMYYRLQDYSFSNIDKFSTSSLITRLTTDVSNVQNAFQMLIRMAARSPLMLIFSGIMAFRVNARLALIFLCVVPFLAVGLTYVATHAHPVFRKVFKTYDSLNNVVQENVRGMRVVKSFVREDYEDKKFEDISGQVCTLFTKAERIIALNSPLMQFAMYACTLLISWFGAKFILSSVGQPNAMSTGELNSLLTYSMQILGSLMMLSFMFVMLTISRASGERICEVLDEQSDLHSPENALTEISDGSVDFDGVSFSYAGNKKRLCLEDVNLHIHSGETIGIVGGTGSSKSTLVQLIPRLYDATEGVVKVGGHDVKEYDLEALRNSVAMVLQKNVLFAGTIRENLRWGNPDATDEELVAACRLAQAHEFIEGFPQGYDTFIEQGGSNVSGGQKQRLCIARAILKKPKILILDDSTSAVDTRTDALIREGMKKIIPGTTTFIIAQRISSVMDADKIIVLDGGRVNGFGTHDELMQTNEIYREVYTSQTKGGGDYDE
ncbi:MAG: ABC transporter ATP-binding protein/permease [Clostridiales bacterium]|nr:ABC transporter ATP-binding protein/permease [Clostridiales bacterium]